MKKWLPSLKTKTPEEGYQLAIRLSTKAIELIQPNEQIRRKIRPKYSKDPDNLIAAAHVIATNFQTVAAANNYWKDSKNSYNYKPR